MNFLTSLCLSGLFLIFSACGNYKSPKNPDSAAPQGPNVEEEVEALTTSFSSVQSSVFSRCISCHQEKFENYKAVMEDLGDIASQIASDNMPKTGGPLTDFQKKVLSRWIAKGAPEFGNSPPLPPESPPGPMPMEPPDMPPAGLEPTWKSIQANILAPKHCVQCHNPSGAAKFLDLGSYQVILDQRSQNLGNGPLFDFESPEESRLIKRLEDEDDPMPPVVSGASRLTNDEIKVLTLWIRLGLPE